MINIHSVISTLLCGLLLLSASSLSASDQKPASIPIRLEDGHILVWAKINDQGPFEFVIDSGGGGSHMISEAIALKAGVKLGKKSTGYSAGGAIPQRNGGKQTFSFQNGQNHLVQVYVEKYTFGAPPIGGETPLAGTLGTPLFNQYVVEFDFEHLLMRLHDINSWHQPQNTNVVKLHFGWFANVPKVRTIINGKRTKLILDTGAFAPAIITRKAARKFNLQQIRDSESISTGAARLDVTEVLAPNIKIGNQHFSNLTLLAVEPVGRGFNGHGVLGMGILACQRIWISYKHKRMYLGEKARNETCEQSQ